MGLEESFLSQEKQKTSESKERSVAEKEESLDKYCQQHNNPLVFLKKGQDSSEKLTLANSWKTLDEYGQNFLKILLERAQLFLASPAFTDSFHENHDARRIWEDEYITSNLEADSAKHYHTNRFGLNNLSLPFLFQSWLETIQKTDSLDKALHDKSQKIIGQLNSAVPDYLKNYNNLKDEEKYQVIEKMEIIFRDIVNLLSGK